MFTGDNMMAVKRNNRGAILRYLHMNDAVSRKRLAEGIGLTAAAITKIVGEMKLEGLVSEGDTVATGNAGRREILLSINADYGYALGVFINIGKAIVSCVDLKGAAVFLRSVKIQRSAPAESTVKMLSELLMQLLDEYSIPKDKVIGLGIAIRGRVSDDMRISADSYGALADKNYPICERFEKLTGFRTILENNVRALQQAQLFFVNDGENQAQYFIRCEYGIGSSLSLNREIWRGVHQTCGEIGHIPVVRTGGKLCSCGRKGCLETIASPTAILETAGDILSPEKTPVLWKIHDRENSSELTLEEIFNAYEQGDEGIVPVVDHAVTELSKAIDMVSKVFDPGKIILYGALFEHSVFLDKLIADAAEYMPETVIEKSAFNCQLEKKAASLLAIQNFYDNGGFLK